MALRTLSPELDEVARRELNEDPKRREQDLQHIRDWLSKQPHLTARTDAQWLLTFLRGCKFSLERTKQKLDMFYTMRTALPELFSNRDPLLPELQYLLKLGVMIPLRDPGDKGHRVVILRVGLYDPAVISVVDLFKLSFMIMDILKKDDDHLIVKGDISIIDLAYVTLGHAAQLVPTVVKKAMTASQEGYPIRHGGVHYIHTPHGFETVFNLFKSFMKEKLKKRLYVHGDNVDALYEHIPKKILPQEYGGDAGPIDKLAGEWKEKVEAHRTWFLEDEKYRSDEKKRPGKAKTQEDLFGMEGSFRKLDVD